MKKYFIVIVLSLILLGSSAPLIAWGSATHAYFARQLGAKWGPNNIQEMYGAMLPDVFNLMYGAAYRDFLFNETHFNFDKFLAEVNTCRTTAAAFGFASHNRDWGADSMADLYVPGKVTDLIDIFAPMIAPILQYPPYPPYHQDVLELAGVVADLSVETAVEVLVRETLDKNIGSRIYMAAELRNWRIPWQLVSAYSEDLKNHTGMSQMQASVLIYVAEAQFRDLMKQYGLIFTQTGDDLRNALAEQGATLAEMYLATKGYDISVLPEYMKNFLNIAIDAVAGDFYDEVSGTLAYLESEMAARGIETCTTWFALGKEGEQEIEANIPAEFALSQNYPNPFNPETTINYSLPVDTHVRVTVFDALGRQVCTLVDGMKQQGYHSVTWQAANMASGVYFYRMETAGFSRTKKMFLVK